MAISYKSKLYDSERIFTIAVEWCKDQPLEGVLYQGNQQTGVCFTGYYELAWQMERCFAQLQYPRSVMDMRELRGKRGCRAERGCAGDGTKRRQCECVYGSGDTAPECQLAGKCEESCR